MDKETTPTPNQPPGAKYRGAVVEVRDNLPSSGSSAFKIPTHPGVLTTYRIYSSRQRSVCLRMRL
jgi:hypothetical protein